MHDLGVDAGHDEGREPRLSIFVVDRFADIRLAHAAARVFWAYSVGVLHEFAQLRIILYLGHDVDQTRHRAAAGTTAHCLYTTLYLRAVLAEFCMRLLLREPDAEIGRDRVETTIVHDACAGLDRLGLVGIDHASHPLRFTGEIAVVGALPCTGCNQVRAVQGVGAYRADDDARARGHGGHGVGVRRIGYDFWQRLRAEFLRDGVKLCPVAAGQRPSKRAGGAVALHEVARKQSPDKTGGAINNEIEFAFACHDELSVRVVGPMVLVQTR